MLVNQHTSVLVFARKLKNVNFFGASDARRVNLQRLYTLAKVLRVFIKKTDSLKFLLLAFTKLASFVLYSV